MEQRLAHRWISPLTLVDEIENMQRYSNNPSGLELSEDQTHIYVEASLPGLTQDEIDITYEKGALTIRGEKKETEEDKNKKYYRRSSRSFMYQMEIPSSIEESVEPKAEFTNGVAKITFEKKKKELPKKITFS